MSGQPSETALNRMLAIVDQHEKARWFPPAAFNVEAWAIACKVGTSTIDDWLNNTGAPIVKRPGGPRGERFIALKDFWIAVPAEPNRPDKPKPRRRSA